MNFARNKLLKILPSILYVGLCTFILLLDFNIWIEGSAEYPKFYIMPIVYSLIFLVILIFLIKYIRSKKELSELPSEISYNKTWILFIAYLAVIWFPRQFMIWKFGVTFEKIPILYLIVTQIVLLEGIFLTEFGLKREQLVKNVILGCIIALIDISMMTIINILIPVIIQGPTVLSSLETFDITQFITFPWQLIAVGISEELFFRGYFFTKFRKSGKSFWHSAVITSFVFMIFHIPWLITIDFELRLYIPYVIWRVINIFPFGLVCCALYEKTTSLTAPIIYHGFSNSLSTFIVVNIGPNFIIEFLIWIIAFFVLLGIAFLTPLICKLFRFGNQ
ncbi:MAG: lysostaphin resistance A-like protein [Candidatus Thorarchaeota archaeon]